MAHIVDVLIEERAERLRQHPLLWRLVRQFLYPSFGYRQAMSPIDRVLYMTGLQIFEYMSERLQLQVEVRGLQNLPTSGLANLVANHTSGIADGFVVYDAVKQVRRDLVMFANRDAVRAAPGMADVVVPVEWMETRRNYARNKETVRSMARAFRAGKLVVIFPAGRLARPTVRGLEERPWVTAPVNLAQRFGCSILPVHITGKNSLLYYALYAINNELSDMTLFREVLNKEGCPYRVDIGKPINPVGDVAVLTDQILDFVARQMPAGADEFKFA